MDALPPKTRTALWLTRLALVGLFGFMGTAKLVGADFEIEAFERWGYPQWFRLLAGATEVGAAVGLLIPDRRVLLLSILTLVGTMLGALGTVIYNGEWSGVLLPAATLLVLLGLGRVVIRGSEA